MMKRLAWIVVLAAAAAGGCLTGSGAIRRDTADRSANPSTPSHQTGAGEVVPPTTLG